MYDELIQRLRICAKKEANCVICGKMGEGDCFDRIKTEAADAIEDLENKLNLWRQDKVSRWIPVTERLPEDLQNVLVIDDGRVTIGHCEHYCGDEQIYVEWHDTLYYPIDPPCWMPLPEPPKEETC